MGVEREGATFIKVNGKRYAKPRGGVMQEAVDIDGVRFTRQDLKIMEDSKRPDYPMGKGREQFHPRYQEPFGPMANETPPESFLRYQEREIYCKCESCGTFGAYATKEGACHECGCQDPPKQLEVHVLPWDENDWGGVGPLVIFPFADEPVSAVHALVGMLTGRGADPRQHALVFEARRMRPDKTLLDFDIRDRSEVYLKAL